MLGYMLVGIICIAMMFCGTVGILFYKRNEVRSKKVEVLFTSVVILGFLGFILFGIPLKGTVHVKGDVWDAERLVPESKDHQLHFLTVSVGTIDNWAEYLLSKIFYGWDVQYTPDYATGMDFQTEKERSAAGVLSLEGALQNATVNVGKKVEKDFTYTKKVVVAFPYSSDLFHAKDALKAGDEIVSVYGVKVNSIQEIKSVVSKEVKDNVTMVVKRDGKEKEVTYRVNKIYLDATKLGFYPKEVFMYKIPETWATKISGVEQGNSVGLMTSLQLYYEVTGKDIDKGIRISGTGAINEDGTVGEIGGVYHKVKASNDKNVDLMIVPEGNYEEAIKAKEKLGSDIPIVGVKTFDEALIALDKYTN